PAFLIQTLVAPELPLRPPQKLRRLGLAQITPLPAVVNTRKLLHSPVLVTLGPAHPRPPDATRIEKPTDYRTNRVLQNPDNSLAADNCTPRLLLATQSRGSMRHGQETTCLRGRSPAQADGDRRRVARGGARAFLRRRPRRARGRQRAAALCHRAR